MTATLRPLLLLALVLPLLGQAPADVVARIRAEGSGERSQVMKHLHELVNGIGPRLTSSERCAAACAWAVETFKSFGLESARTEEWGTFPVGFDRGVRRGRITAPKALDLVFTTPAWTPGTVGVWAGAVRPAPTDLAEVEKDPGAWKGTWILGGGRGAARADRARREEVLVAAGVLGVIQKAGNELVITGGNHRIAADALPRLVTIQLQGKQYAEIEALLAGGTPVEAEFEIENRFRPGPIPLHNVLAELPGTELPEELVIVGGHIDSWDGATGTTDNGTGVATTIEAARILCAAQVRPRRTIRFMLWSGEEQGLLGSRAYIRAHPEEYDRISAVLVHDGGTNYVSGIAATEAMRPQLETALRPLIGLDPELPFKIRPVRSLPMGIGSDHDSYLAAGVPGFFWDQGGRANYTRTHHTQYDTYDAAIPEYQRHTAMVVAIAALGIANLPEKLDRTGMRARSAPEAGRGPRRRLGITPGEDDLTIAEVQEDSVAARAGLQRGDLILKIDGREVKDLFGLRDLLADGGPEKTLLVRRAGREITIPVRFEDAPAPAR
jgi:carboxypeptidase Q